MTTENIRVVALEGTSSGRRVICQYDTGFGQPTRPTFAVDVPFWMQSTLKVGDALPASMQPSLVEAVGGGGASGTVTVYTFLPGGVSVPASRIYALWPDLVIAHNADTGQREIDFDDTSGAIVIPNGFARGSITTVGGALLVDGEQFVLNDGVNPAVTFEFDSNGSVTPTATLRAVVFTGGDSAGTVRDAIIAAINGAPTLAITASVGGAAVIALVNDAVGLATNVAITETVANAGFVVTGMTGGMASSTLTMNTRTRLMPKTGRPTPMAVTLSPGVVLSQPYFVSPLLNFQA